MASKQLPRNTVHKTRNLRIGLFGQFNVSSDDGNVVVRARKDMAVLAYLANAPGEHHRRSALASLLWPQSDDSRARESLKQSLLRVRRALPEGLLITDRQTAGLLIDREHVDLTRAEDWLAEGSYEALLRVTDRVEAGFLAELCDVSDAFAEWCHSRYQCLLDNIHVAMQAALQAAQTSGNLEQTVNLARAASRLDPLDEESVRYLIRAYATHGRPRRAQQVFDELKSLLLAQLNVEPEPATVRLIDSLHVQRHVHISEKNLTTPRIAVLMYEIGSEDCSQQFFAEGLTDDITTDLSRNKRLDVLPANAFSAVQGDVSQALLSRGVTHTLHGSIRGSAEKLRINTRLVDVVSDQIIWAQRYDSALDDIFEMQDAITSNIVASLQVELSEDFIHSADRDTRHPGAYRMFHKGRSLYLRGINNHTLQAAKALLERAIALDPHYARAYAQLAICESCLAMSIVNKTGEDYSGSVLKHARVALDMNPDLALGHAASGLAFYASGQYHKAEIALQAAIELDRNLFEAQFFLARNRRQQGDHAGAIERFRSALELRPDDFRSSGLLADALKAIGQEQEAHELFKATIELIELELEHHPDNAGALAFGAPILAELNCVEQAREWSEWALAIEPEDSLLRYNQARLYAILNEADSVREHLERAYDAPILVQRRLALWMRYDRDFDAFRYQRWFRHLLGFGNDRSMV